MLSYHDADAIPGRTGCRVIRWPLAPKVVRVGKLSHGVRRRYSRQTQHLRTELHVVDANNGSGVRPSIRLSSSRTPCIHIDDQRGVKHWRHPPLRLSNPPSGSLKGERRSRCSKRNGLCGKWYTLRSCVEYEGTS